MYSAILLPTCTGGNLQVTHNETGKTTTLRLDERAAEIVDSLAREPETDYEDYPCH